MLVALLGDKKLPSGVDAEDVVELPWCDFLDRLEVFDARIRDNNVDFAKLCMDFIE